MYFQYARSLRLQGADLKQNLKKSGKSPGKGAVDMSADIQERMPALYLSHGAPPLADDPIWPGELAAWSADLPRPKAILMVSAHWEEAPLAIGAIETIPLVYDFWGFPEHYYQVEYAAPGAPQLAESVRKLLRAPATPVHDDPRRGLDHGAYV